MKEVKTPKKPLAYYYGIVLIAVSYTHLDVYKRQEYIFQKWQNT